MTERFASRETVVSELRDQLLHDSFPRLTVLTIVLLAGGCAFLFSALTLSAGLHSMGPRYGLAALAGYVSFALLIRAWISMRRDHFDLLLDLPTLDLRPGTARAPGADAPRLFMGGRSGGGGTNGAWVEESGGTPPGIMSVPVGATAGSSADTRGGSGGGWFSVFDGDDAWRIVIAAALAFGAVIAAAFVVYSAPVLLAEVALDAGVMAAVYRRVRRQELGHWTGAVLRRTWLPALVITVFVTGAGYLLQIVAPDARSIGGVVRALSHR